MIGAADWVIDLGPEGGDAGGRVVFEGRVAELLACPSSHTGVALAGPRRAAVGGTRCGRRARAGRRCAPTGGSASVRTRAQPEGCRLRDPARPLHRGDRRFGQRQEHARVRHPVRRGPAPLPRVAERVRAAVRRSRRRGRRRCDLRHPADCGDRAAHEPRRPQEHGRDADRDLSLPAAPLREARNAALSRARRPDRAANAGQHRRIAPAPATAAGASSCSRRSLSRRKGYYTDLAKWAARRGVVQLRVDGEMLSTAKWPRLDRFKEHTIECRSRSSSSPPANERGRCAKRARPGASRSGKGVVHALATNGRAPRAKRRTARRVYSTQRACPVCSRSFRCARSAAILV